MSSRDRLRWIFVGSGGIRAGWSVLIFLLLVALQFGLVIAIYKAAHGPDPSHIFTREIPPWFGLLQEVVGFAVMVIATLIMSRIEGRPVVAYGFSGERRLQRFAYGAIAGILAMLTITAILVFRQNLVIDGRVLHGGAILAYAAVWGLFFILVGFTEEGMLRGYLQYTLTRGLNFFWAAVILSIVFAAVHSHNPGESPFGLFQVIIIGLVFCYSLWLTGSLWWAVGIHAAWDWMQSYALGTADSGIRMQGHLLASHPLGPALWSGGTTGPEGSLYTLPILAILAAGLYLAWGRNPAGIRTR